MKKVNLPLQSFCLLATLLVSVASYCTSSCLPVLANPLPETSQETFSKDVLTSSKPVVVDFSATWCKYCKLMAPTLETLCKTYDGRAVFFTVDIDKNPSLKAQYKVRPIPRILVFNKGEIVADTVGCNDGKSISAKLDELVSKIPVVNDNF